MNKLKDKVKQLKKLGAEATGLNSSSTSKFKGTGHRLGSVEPKHEPTLSAQLASGPATATRPQSPLQSPYHQPAPPTDQQPLPPAPATHAPGEVQSAIALLRSSPTASPAADVLYRLLRNIASSPEEDKYRRIRLNNPKIEAAVVHSDGGVELLLACGFDIEFPDQGEGDEGAGDGFAILDKVKDLSSLKAALPLLAPLLSQPAPTAPPATAATATAVPRPPAPRPERQWDAARDRQTRVILPTSVDADVPSWFFERTGFELKSFFVAAAKRREQEQMLMTRAMRERLATQNKSPQPTHAVIKVRLPEGISFQGEFNGGEPVVAVFGWVADCLRSPLETYDLIQPDRKALEVAEKSIRQAGLMPSVTLNLRWTGQSAVAMKQMPALRDELLRSA